MRVSIGAMCLAVLVETLLWPFNVRLAAAQSEIEFKVSYGKGPVTKFSANWSENFSLAVAATLQRLRAGTLREVQVRSYADVTVREDRAEFSQVRANALADDLAAQGIPRELITAIGMGDRYPNLSPWDPPPPPPESVIVILEQAKSLKGSAPEPIPTPPPRPPQSPAKR